MKTVIKCLLILVSSVAIGLGLLNLVWLIPTDNEATVNHLRESAEIYRDEKTYQANVSKFSPDAQLDNFTDSLILLISAEPGEEGLSTNQKAINARHPMIDKENDSTVMITKHYLENEPYTSYLNYPRYWHGYQIFVRPLIRFFNMHRIRIINMLAQLCFIALIIFLMFKKNYKYLILPFILTWLTLVPMTVFKCLQYSSCFYCLAIAVVLLLLTKEHTDKKVIPIFLISGILTAYFDFLTYPIITLGVPLAMYLAIKNTRNFKQNFFSILKLGIVWSVGYLGMWGSKWLIAGPDVIKSAANEAGLWTNSATDKITAIEKNLNMFLDNKLMILLVIFCTVIITMIVVEYKRQKKLRAKEVFKNIAITFAPYLIIIAMPFAWYFAASAHSTIHWWFTFRSLAVAAFALLIGLVQIYRQRDKKPLKKT